MFAHETYPIRHWACLVGLPLKSGCRFGASSSLQQIIQLAPRRLGWRNRDSKEHMIHGRPGVIHQHRKIMFYIPGKHTFCKRAWDKQHATMSMQQKMVVQTPECLHLHGNMLALKDNPHTHILIQREQHPDTLLACVLPSPTGGVHSAKPCDNKQPRTGHLTALNGWPDLARRPSGHGRPPS